MIDLRELFGLPPVIDTRSEEEKRLNDLCISKLKEYKQHFNADFTTENLCMTDKELIRNIDKCIKYNRKWEGFIVPELDYDEVEI
ncbi:MAG: hypothetical protein IJ368_00435 [Oscillospiraceae bacterium]|nr:hypothetical protein [Oscillospiraceae bacterium]